MSATRLIRYAVFTAPASDPITLAEAKSHLHVTDTDSDAYITGLITAATKSCEVFTRRAFYQRTLEGYLDLPPTGTHFELWPSPVVSITEIASYNDAGTKAVFASANYWLDTFSVPARVVINSTSAWPSDVRTHNAFYVKWVAGYGAAAATDPQIKAAIPDQIKHAIKLLVTHMFEERAPLGAIVNPLPMSISELLTQFKVFLT